MKWDDFRQSDNVEDRRGSSGGGGGPIRIGGAGGLGLGGIVVVLLISYFTGISPQTLLGGLEMINGGGSGPTISQPEEPSAPPSDRVGTFVAKVLGSTEDTWTTIFQDQVGSNYEAPRLVLFTGGTRSACGAADSAMGPFYCPNDQRVYLDTSFFQEMKTRFQACPPGSDACEFAQAYVVAHEIGHHVQNLLGILPKVHEARQNASEVESNALSVRTELQADCFAGVWAFNADKRWRFLEPGDVEAALQTASAIGDDMLQRRSRGVVVPDSFTHGSSAQRQRWFLAGLKKGQLDACNTFSARQL